MRLPAIAAARRLSFGLQTVLGLRRRGYFIPYRYADAIPEAAARQPYAALEPLFDAARPAFASLLDGMDRHADALEAIGGAPPPQPRWSQDWFPRLDAAAAYTLVRERRPARLVEIGSGHSTRFLARAARDARIRTHITAIDPHPRADIEGLGVQVVRATLQTAGCEAFDALRAGDLLFIDSSHILMPGTDVDLLINQVLPALPGGVLVHVHDIFLPDPYPESWRWRGYNEQLGVAALLQGGGYRLVWASRYVATRMAADVAASAAGRLELMPGAFEASLWLEKT